MGYPGDVWPNSGVKTFCVAIQGEVGGPLLCPGQGYRALLGKRVPSCCSLCLIVYHSSETSAVLSEVGLVGFGAEHLRIHSNILTITCPVLKNADFSEEMSSGAVE